MASIIGLAQTLGKTVRPSPINRVDPGRARKARSVVFTMGRAALWNDARRRTGAWREARLLEQKAHVSCEGTMIRVEEGPHFERIRHTRADHFLKVEHAQSRAVGCDGFRHRPLDQEPARLVNNPRGAVGRVIARTEGGGRIRAGLARQPRARRYQDPVFLSPIGNGFLRSVQKGAWPRKTASLRCSR
jgi:hypothetical protein